MFGASTLWGHFLFVLATSTFWLQWLCVKIGRSGSN